MLNKKDKKILMSLVTNGRISYSDIGKSVGMTRQTVYSRIKLLKRKKIIEKFSTQISKRVIGLNLKAYIFIVANPEKKLRKQLEEGLKGMAEVAQIDYLYGRFDILAHVLVRDINELTEILRKIQEMGAVNKTETFIVYDQIKYDPESPVKKVLSE